MTIQNVVHVDGAVNPGRDIEVVEAELIFKDLDTIGKRLTDALKKAKTGDKKQKGDPDFYVRVRDHLFSGRLARYVRVENDDERYWMRDLLLLTNKSVMYVCNVHERDVAGENAYVAAVREIAAKEAKVVTVSAALEAEIAELPIGERKGFLEGLGLQESGLDKVVREGYDLLHLITFFTVGPKEVHAWTP